MFGRGGAAIVEPTGGEVIAGPLYDEEGMIFADGDLAPGGCTRSAGSMQSGHYSGEAALGNGERPASSLSSPHDGDGDDSTE